MSSFQSSMLYSLILAVAGYFIISLIGIGNSEIFAAGLAIGGIFIAIISNSSNTEQPTASPAIAKDKKELPSNSKTIYVGNLPYRANEAVIKELFEKFGDVHSVRLLKDRQTGKRRGFGFVEMAESGAAKAIQSLNESEFQQRTLKVREAKDRPEKEQDETLQTQS